MAKGATSGTKPLFTQKFPHLTFLYFSFSFIVLELILINSYSFVGSPKRYLGAPTGYTWPTFQFSLCSEDCQGHLALGILGGHHGHPTFITLLVCFSLGPHLSVYMLPLGSLLRVTPGVGPDAVPVIEVGTPCAGQVP